MSNHTILLVLGLNRSGTSALAGSLRYCGVELDFEHDGLHAGLRKQDRFRPDGGYESFEVLPVIHYVRRITQRFGGHQNNPVIGDEIHYSATDVLSLIGLVDLVPGYPFLIKDPLLTFHFRQWRRTIIDHFEGVSVLGIASMREPYEQAQALMKRGFCSTIRSGLDQWLRYYSEVDFLQRAKEPVYVVVYDRKPQAFTAQIESLCHELGLPFDKAGVESFFRPALSGANDRPATEEHRIDDHPLGESLTSLFRRLASRSRHPYYAGSS